MTSIIAQMSVTLQNGFNGINLPTVPRNPLVPITGFQFTTNSMACCGQSAIIDRKLYATMVVRASSINGAEFKQRYNESGQIEYGSGVNRYFIAEVDLDNPANSLRIHILPTHWANGWDRQYIPTGRDPLIAPNDWPLALAQEFPFAHGNEFGVSLQSRGLYALNRRLCLSTAPMAIGGPLQLFQGAWIKATHYPHRENDPLWWIFDPDSQKWSEAEKFNYSLNFSAGRDYGNTLKTGWGDHTDAPYRQEVWTLQSDGAIGGPTQISPHITYKILPGT
jgi:hypothetical protein